MRVQRFRLILLVLLAAGVTPGCSDDAPVAAVDVADVADAALDAVAEHDLSPSDLGASDIAADVADVALGPDAEVGAPIIEELITGAMAFDLVDPFIGTGGLGFGYAALTPAAQMPFGLVRLGPDTTQRTSHPGFNHFSGYYDLDSDVRGFSHLHFVATGVPDYGNLRVMPQRSVRQTPPHIWYTALDKQSEQASPGYYTARLPDEQVQVELTASEFGGFHRYSFDGEGVAHLTIDAGSSVTNNDVIASHVEVTANKITGWATHAGPYTGRSRPFTVHFSITIEPAADAVWTWQDGEFNEEATSAEGNQTGAVLRFEALQRPVELRVGVSIVDLDAAEANRVAQLDGKSLEQVRAAARTAWIDKLGRARIKGANADVATIFYTALYNVYRMPTRFDGVDGRYRGLDGEVHTTDGWTYYTDLSLWDTFRTLHPWLSLTDVDEQRHVLRSLAAMRKDGGYFPRWPAALSYTGGMLGSWADVLFAESALKGIEGVDYADAYVGLRELAMVQPPPAAGFSGRSGIAEYIEHGYVPVEAGHDSASRTLEYAWGDFALANLAGHLDYTEDEALFRQRAGYYKNLFHSDSGFFRPRHADGSFDLSRTTETVHMGGGPFTEGSAWHWRFYALHDPSGLVELFGGKAALDEALEAFFAKSALGKTRPINTVLPDIYYWHGNEPAIHAALLFHSVDRYDRLAHWVRQIQTRLYTTGRDGIPGNDDGGTLSAWYLFNALGLYPVAGSDRYLLSVPIVPYAELDTASGTLIIEADGAAPRDQRVAAVSLDGEPIEGGELRHAQLQAATLRFSLSEP
ncbi:MAG: glycoside hydrolase family 92 protein [Bradymonadaceae bacterium]|nr:glycoside hydrolase family 92 protein [Lujinxingiaceae bacterium]